MNFKEIKELIKIIDESGLSEICIEQDDLKLTLKKPSKMEVSSSDNMNINEILLRERIAGLTAISNIGMSNTSAPVGTSALINETNASNPQSVKVEDNAHYVKSPIVGVFYSSPTPDAPAFVKAGDKIKQGQVLCIVEAMKMMNEITSDVDGEVIEVLLQNQGTVEYGQPLFKIRKA